MKPEPLKRKWMKPLMIAVPIFLLMAWVYTALQFPSLPPFSFLPKDFKLKGGGYSVGLTSLLSPVLEQSSWESATSQTMPTEKCVEELKRFGFRDSDIWFSGGYRVFEHPNGDVLWIALNPENYKAHREFGIKLQYMHMETRPLYCLVKRLKALYDEKFFSLKQTLTPPQSTDDYNGISSF